MTGNHQVIDLVDKKSDESVQAKKRKMPRRSSKEKTQNYVGEKSESENEDDLIPYKIPRKNEMKEIKIEKKDNEVSLFCGILILCFSHLIKFYF